MPVTESRVSNRGQVWDEETPLTRSINQFLEMLLAGLFIWVFSAVTPYQLDNNCHAFNGRPLLFLVVLIWVDMIAQKINGFFPFVRVEFGFSRSCTTFLTSITLDPMIFGLSVTCELASAVSVRP